MENYRRTRVFGGVLCLMGSLLAISYSGTLFSFLAVTSSPKLLKTIEELSTLPPSMKLGNNGIRHKECVKDFFTLFKKRLFNFNFFKKCRQTVSLHTENKVSRHFDSIFS